MAHPVLLGPRNFPEGLPEGRIEEQGVVAEPLPAPRLLRDEPLHRLFHLEEHFVAPGQGDGAREARPALGPGYGLQLLEEKAIAVVVARALAAEAARVEAGGPAEGIHREPG